MQGRRSTRLGRGPRGNFLLQLLLSLLLPAHEWWLLGWWLSLSPPTIPADLHLTPCTRVDPSYSPAAAPRSCRHSHIAHITTNHALLIIRCSGFAYFAAVASTCAQFSICSKSMRLQHGFYHVLFVSFSFHCCSPAGRVMKNMIPWSLLAFKTSVL